MNSKKTNPTNKKANNKSIKKSDNPVSSSNNIDIADDANSIKKTISLSKKKKKKTTSKSDKKTEPSSKSIDKTNVPKNNEKKNTVSKSINKQNSKNRNIDKKEVDTKVSKHEIKKQIVKTDVLNKLSKNEQTTQPAKIYKPSKEFYELKPELKLTKSQKENDLVKKVLNAVEHYFTNEMFFDDSTVIVAGVSGGVDSVVMMDLLALLSEKYLYKLYIAHFNHKLRDKASDRDENFVKELALKYNLEFKVAKGNVKTYAEKNSLSIEQAGRTLRYNFFEKTTRTLEAGYLATAHTLDDTVETFFMNLFRGSGLTGLSGIPIKRNLVKNVMLIRPLINLKKQDLIEYAKIRNLKWNEDETNLLVNFRRNKIRHELIPLLTEEYNPNLCETIARTCNLVSAADNVISSIVNNNLQKVSELQTPDRFSINIPLLETFNTYIKGEVIQAAIKKYFKLQPLTISTVDRILQLTNSIVGSICEINKYYSVLRDRRELIFIHNNYFVQINKIVECPGEIIINEKKFTLDKVRKNQIKFNDNQNVEFFDADLLSDKLGIRNWNEGDIFSPLGMLGTMKVSDFLTNLKIPLIDKNKVLVLTNGLEIIWVIGHRISEKYKISDKTKKYIKAEISEL